MWIPSLMKKFCNAIWEYDAENNEIYFHYDTMNPELCNRWMPYDEINQMYREKYVYKLDLEIWDQFLSREKLCHFIDGEKEEEHFCLRLEPAYKGSEWHEVYFQRVDKKRILLSRTDAGELIGEKKLREKEREKRLRYLQTMPVAFCSTKVLLDEKGEPYDFQFTYCNRAHEELECVKEGELLGKNFYEFFSETDPKWLKYYYETAYKGINHVIRRYSPEIQKHLLLYTFQSEIGHCECVLLDVSEEYFLTQELERSREDLRRILKTTTALVYQYRPELGEVIIYGKEKEDPEQVLTKEILRKLIIENELLDSEYWKEFEDAFLRIKGGEHFSSVVVRCRLYPGEKWNWYRITMFDFQDGYTHERKVLGFLQNIDQDRSREEEFRKKAQMDSLTGVLNSGAGKQEIAKKLERKGERESDYYAMFVIDMDNFKTVNDTKGHLTGDKVLVEFAKILRKTFRTEDVIYRLGGDEFVVFVDKIHEPEQSIGVMLHRFQFHMEEANVRYPFLACSVGVFVTNKRHSFEKCYEIADKALYETKKSNKGYYTITKES